MSLEEARDLKETRDVGVRALRNAAMVVVTKARPRGKTKAVVPKRAIEQLRRVLVGWDYLDMVEDRRD